MPWTTPPTFAADTQLAAADLNILGDDLVFLKGQTDGAAFSGVKLTRDSGDSPITLTTATWTDLTYVTETFDIGAWWSSGASATVPAGAVPAGFTTVVADIDFYVRFVSNSTGNRQVNILVNGSTVEPFGMSALTGEATVIAHSAKILVEAGDAIKLQGYQTSGGNLNVDVCRLTVVRLAGVS